MTKPVNILAFRYEPEATLNRGLKIYIDQESLLGQLEQSAQLFMTQPWREKNDACVDLSQLAESIEKSGSFSILICAHCADEGYHDCEDLLLQEFQVVHKGEFVFWEINPPGYKFFFEDSQPLKFRFHLPQYKTAIQKILTA